MGGEEEESRNLLGPPTFTELQNGRLKCVETGHELFPSDKDMYSNSKRCRLGLIDFAVSKRKPPLNLFKPDPLNRSRLICKLTRDTVNMSEGHIWKHLNGKRFLNKLGLMEMGKLEPNGEVGKKANEEEENGDEKKKKNKMQKKKKREKKAKTKEEIVSQVRDIGDKDSDSEEVDFGFPLQASAGTTTMEEIVGVIVKSLDRRMMKKMMQFLKTVPKIRKSSPRGRKECP